VKAGGGAGRPAPLVLKDKQPLIDVLDHLFTYGAGLRKNEEQNHSDQLSTESDHPQSGDVERILSAFPRLKMKERFADTCCRLVTARPETSYDNFLRDFGERFVPGYKSVSTVDLLMNAPFDE